MPYRNFHRRRCSHRFRPTGDATEVFERSGTCVRHYTQRRLIPRPKVHRLLRLDTRLLVFDPLRLPPVLVSHTALSNCRLEI
ncbi:hypothetical protein HanIR_Chr09g0411221 [Helianthus annuus]|nr:hypothetical protein HanIR_Chr09g0411221 [Helianthus annuus]